MSKLQVLGEYVSVGEALEAYNQYRKTFAEQADIAKLRFSQLYQANNSLDDVVKNVPTQAEESIRPVIDFCVKRLLEHNILAVDRTTFQEQYAVYQTLWSEPYMAVFDRYAEIALDQKALDEYRVYRRQTRARWSGGGFGLSGAMKGAFTAGALNMVTGAGHMVFNGVGKLISTISANAQKNKIFRNPKTYDSISQGVWYAAFWLHFALIDALSKAGVATTAAAGAITEEAGQQAAAMRNNAELITDPEKKKSVLRQAFLLDPYQEDWYRLVLQEFGDQDGQLECLEEYFGISVIQQTKHDMLEKYLRTLPLDTEAHALEAQRRQHEMELRLHFFGETEQGQKIEAAIEEFDRLYRTVDGILLPTRSEADEAKQELAQIQKIEEKTNYQDLHAIEQSEKRLREFHTQVARPHQEAMHRRWTELDLSLRTVAPLLNGSAPLVCSTKDEADELRAIVQKVHQRYVSCGEGISAEEQLQSFQEYLRNVELPIALKEEYEKIVCNRLKEIDLELRTALGKEYSSREAAANAQHQYHELESALEISIAPEEAEKLRAQIASLDAGDDAKNILSEKLYQRENEKEIRAVTKISNVCMVILLGIIILSYLFHVAGTVEFARNGISVLGVPLKLEDIRVVEKLTFLDGLKNGLSVFGQSIGNMVVDGFLEYIRGFDYGLLGNIAWAILGLFWVIIKQFIIVIPRYLVSLCVTFFQSASIGYYIGYIVGSAITIVICSNIVDEDEGIPVEQVERFKKIKSKLGKRSSK